MSACVMVNDSDISTMSHGELVDELGWLSSKTGFCIGLGVCPAFHDMERPWQEDVPKVVTTCGLAEMYGLDDLRELLRCARQLPDSYKGILSVSGRTPV